MGIVRVVVPVEAPHLVGTVIGAITSADAAVIDLLVDALGAGGGREHRAYRFARRVSTVLAHHRLVDYGRIVLGTVVVVINTNPVHDPSALDLILSDDGNVVFRLAGDHASRASDARVQVDHHAPGVFALRLLVPQGGQAPIGFGNDLRSRVKGREARLENDGPALHGKLGLGTHRLVTPSRPFESDAGCAVAPKATFDRRQRKYVAAHALADLATAPSSITHSHRDGLLVLPGLYEDREFNARASG